MQAAAGLRDSRITFQRPVAEENDLGEEVEIDWADYVRAWAAVYYGPGSEQREAAQEGGSQAATFEVLANSKTRDLKIGDRIEFGGTWDITAINPIERWGIRVTATRAAQ